MLQPKLKKNGMSVSYVLISSEMGEEKAVMRELQQIDIVKETTRVMGSYDIIIKVEDTTDDLKEAISSKIRTINKIKSTVTLPTS